MSGRISSHCRIFLSAASRIRCFVSWLSAGGGWQCSPAVLETEFRGRPRSRDRPPCRRRFLLPLLRWTWVYARRPGRTRRVKRLSASRVFDPVFRSWDDLPFKRTGCWFSFAGLIVLSFEGAHWDLMWWNPALGSRLTYLGVRFLKAWLREPRCVRGERVRIGRLHPFYL